ncbi:MAG TPA: MBL fold metallo-hydrolase [Halobacteria archaeon]|nr:MBL fold metallo-hydrolase [Halobacteria archaeon]
MKIKILYDDEVTADKKKVIPAHGFSCVIEKDGDRILFDTGWDSRILSNNASIVGVDLEGIDKIVISHAHWDHMGSLPALLPLNERSNKKIYFPSATENMRKEIKQRADLITEKESVEVIRGVYTTGLMGKEIKEQSLLIYDDKGLVIITGCAHQGVDNILERSRELFGAKVYALIGGLHGFSDLDLLRDIELIVPCHCTVEKERIRSGFNSLICGVGTEIEI